MIDIEKRRDILKMIKELTIYFEKTKDLLCEPYNFSNAQSSILIDVFRNEPTRVTDICRRLGKATNTISPMINRLVQNKNLTKKIDENDHRVVTIELTDETRKSMENLMLDINDFTWPIFDLLSPSEFDCIYASLQKLVEITYNSDLNKGE